MIFIQEKKRSGLFKDFWSKKLGGKQQASDIEQQEKEEAVPEEAAPKLPEVPDDLYLLYQKCNGKLSREGFAKQAFQEVEQNNKSAIEDRIQQAEKFAQELQTDSKKLLQLVTQKEEARKAQLLKEIEQDLKEEETAKSEIKEENFAIDSLIKVKFMKDTMGAFIFIFPPFLGGNHVDKESLSQALATAGVKFGISEKEVEKIGSNHLYFRIFQIAEGVFPINGTDGQVIDRIPRATEIDIKEDDKGEVDFKDLNLFRNIHKDDVICDIILPEKGINGCNVKGKMVLAKPGKVAKIPAGLHTTLSADKTQLISEIDGYISFENGKFRVENKLLIKNNVDISVGNLNFLGDIVIEGDVLNGFEVKATGNVYVRGMVEGAKITAGGNIEINKGMNGNRQGVLTAGKDVKCTFLENSVVNAGGTLHAQSIVCCDVFCDDSVKVGYGKGVIIGGSITATRLVEAKIIGSKANRETVITLGSMPHIVTEKKTTKQELIAAQGTMETVEKNINYLVGLPKLPDAKKPILEQLRIQRQLYLKKINDLKLKLQELEEKSNDSIKSHIICDTLYPPVKITIHNHLLQIKYAASKCNIYLSEEKEVVVGTI